MSTTVSAPDLVASFPFPYAADTYRFDPNGHHDILFSYDHLGQSRTPILTSFDISHRKYVPRLSCWLLQDRSWGTSPCWKFRIVLSRTVLGLGFCAVAIVNSHRAYLVIKMETRFLMFNRFFSFNPFLVLRCFVQWHLKKY